MQKKGKDLYQFFKVYFKDSSWEEIPSQVDLLIDVVDFIRPKKNDEDSPVSLKALIHLLKENNTYRAQFSEYLNQLLKNKTFHPLICNAGIPEGSDFFFEIKEKLFERFLPKQAEETDLEFILNQVFFKSEDIEWIQDIKQEELRALFTLLEFKPISSSAGVNSPLSEVLFSLEIMTLRSSGHALEARVMKMVPEYSNLDSPFVAFQNELSLITQRILDKDGHFISPDDEDFKQLFVLLEQCKDYVSLAFKNRKKLGISLKANQDLMRIRRQLSRMEITLPLLAGENQEDLIENTIQLGKQLIKENCYKNNLDKLFDEGTKLLSYEITKHTAKTGEHYITKNKKGYFKMLLTAMGGGFIVGLMCLPKVIFAKLEVSEFIEALLYSLNYSIGFIILYLLGFTLATKQPAMTASTLISAIEEGMNNKGSRREKHQVFAKLFSQVFRSQFVAFVGNVILAFPTALLAVYLIDVYLGSNISEYKWETLITDLNPLASLALLHAGIAGIYLFITGIIAGGISNRNKFNNIYKRIGHHPYLKRKFGKKFAAKLAGFIEKKWAGIMSNFWFGVFMGTTAPIGVFLGLNLDVRHIAFSSGNFALGLYGSGFSLTSEMVVWSLVGIFFIGFMNFWVSFGLSMIIAFKSRRIPFSEFKAIVLSVLSYLANSPQVFIWPPKEQPVEDVNAGKAES